MKNNFKKGQNKWIRINFMVFWVFRINIVHSYHLYSRYLLLHPSTNMHIFLPFIKFLWFIYCSWGKRKSWKTRKSKLDNSKGEASFPNLCLSVCKLADTWVCLWFCLFKMIHKNFHFIRFSLFFILYFVLVFNPR